MSSIRPFRGLRYNIRKINNPSAVITPPYDIISNEERISYYQQSPYNIIRIEYGKDFPSDSDTNNKYTRAASAFNQWIHDKVLIRENEPSYYILEEQFQHRGNNLIRIGLLAAIQLEDYDSNKIRPHELITKAHATDRMNLLRSCKANISPIMGLLNTEKGDLTGILRKYCNTIPDFQTNDSYGTEQRLWIVTDNKALEDISNICNNRIIYIADGHHRYDTALHYQKEQSVRHPDSTGDKLFNFVLMHIIDTQDPGLLMLPTHRLIHKLEPNIISNLKNNINDFFNTDELLSSLPSLSDTIDHWYRTLEAKNKAYTVIGMYGLHGKRLCLLKLKKDIDLNGIMTAQEFKLWNDYDVVLLQRIIVQNMLSINSIEKVSTYMSFTRDFLDAISRVDSGECQMAFLLNNAPISRVIQSADARMRLPQKSTYFHPKPPAGLVISPIWDE